MMRSSHSDWTCDLLWPVGHLPCHAMGFGQVIDTANDARVQSPTERMQRDV
jgi:hypothetical protein